MRILKWKDRAPPGFEDQVLAAKRYEHCYLIAEGTDAATGERHYSASYRDSSLIPPEPERVIGDSFEVPFPTLEQAKDACERDFLRLRGLRQ